MIFRELKDEHSLQRYITLTEKFLSIRFPMEYLKKSKVVACIDDEGEIAGGYMIVLKAPFRVVDSLPDSILEHHSHLHSMDQDSMIELTGLWLSPKVTHKITVFTFWLRLYWDIVRTKKKYIVYAYSLKKSALGKIYSVANPTILFRGMTKMQPGMKEPEEESVELVQIPKATLIPVINPQFFVKKLIAKRTLARNLDYLQVVNAYENQ